MDEFSSARHARLRRRLLTASIVVLSLAGIVPGTLHAGVSQEVPKSAPLDPRAMAQNKRPGETLSERLDRNSGVIHPPAGVDPGIAVPVPDPHPNSTPMIPPPGPPCGKPSVQPK
jgi:hypothetical protein